MPVGSNEGCSVFVAFDTSKTKHAVAVAESGRDGEIRYLGEIESGPEAVERLVRKLAGRYGKRGSFTDCGRKSTLMVSSGNQAWERTPLYGWKFSATSETTSPKTSRRAAGASTPPPSPFGADEKCPVRCPPKSMIRLS